MLFISFVKPVVAGLSTGAFCMSTCFPLLAAFMASEERTSRKNLGLILYFLAGRFLGYMLFALLFGLLGQRLRSPVISLIADASLILVSLVMILQIFGILRRNIPACAAAGAGNKPANTPTHWKAVLMGFLMGVNICPPFLLSLSYVVSLRDVLQSLLYFTIFFLVSSLYFLPMVFVGMLAKIKEIQRVARLSGMITAVLFIVYAAYALAQQLTTGR